MRIGFASIYSWRPHVEHLFYLAGLIQAAGHDAEFLTCDSDLPTCYTRELRNVRPDWQECLMCRAGGIRSYSGKNVSSIGQYKSATGIPPAVVEAWASSSASTLGRFESDEDYESADFFSIVKKMEPVVELAYCAASLWIKNKNLDALCVFNGRMDATRAIFEAGRAANIPVVSLERPWFGDGLQIYPDENCLGLKAVDAMTREWRDKPLTTRQALIAADYIASRFLRQNSNEWRAYNTEAELRSWPIADSKRKILLVPGSRNEIWGHPDWRSGWKHPTEAYDAIMSRFGLDSKDVVLRCHPNWGESIGKANGNLPEAMYTNWAKARGLHVISSRDKTSTLGLIEQCDAIVVSNGSAAFEAGALGKQVIGVASAVYQSAGLRDDACDAEQLSQLTLNVDLPDELQKRKARIIARQTLRFCYVMSRRLPQYTNYVKAQTTTRYLYKDGADASRFLEILRTSKIRADDMEIADSQVEEDRVLDQLMLQNWSELKSQAARFNDDSSCSPINRRPMYRPIDYFRNKIPRGDLQK